MGSRRSVPFEEQYFTLLALQNNTFTFNQVGTGTLYYSTDNGATWVEGTQVTVNAGTNVLWKGQLVANTDGGESASSNGVGNFVATGNFKVCGNVMSLIYEDNFVGQDELLHQFQFSALLSGRKSLISAKDLVLPAMTLTSYCYYSMFYGCTNLTDAPELPATSLPGSCYRTMFSNCTSLVQAPSILPGTPSSTSNYYHYYRMFKGCTSLVTAPVISSTQWGHSSCNEMFYGCTSLVTAPALSATTLQNNCYKNMFYGCTSLTTPPSTLPAATMKSNCYEGMFKNCSSLATAPTMPIFRTATHCCYDMFNGCTSLTVAPQLPAILMTQACYHSMFRGCTSLTTPPTVLPATVIAADCYNTMFYGCSNLETAPELLATEYASGAYSYMFCYCNKINRIVCLIKDLSLWEETWWLGNTASSGTFIRNSNNTGWVSDDANYIPSGWSVENYEFNTYLTFTALADGCQFYWHKNNAGDGVYYSVDDGATWTFIGNDVRTVSVNTGAKVLFKANITPYYWGNNDTEAWRNGVGKIFGTKYHKVAGNPMSLIYGDDYVGKTPPNGGLCNLFKNSNNLYTTANTTLVDAGGLVFVSRGSALRCWCFMFWYCTNLFVVKNTSPNGNNPNSITHRWMEGTRNNADCTFIKRSGVSWNRNLNGIPSAWNVVDSHAI